MAILDELVSQIEDPDLRARIAAEVEKLAKQKKFGLVFEEHLPECTPLWDIPVKKGSKVALKTGLVSDFYTVLRIEDGVATCLNKDKSATAEFALEELVSVAEFGEPIYPYLKPIDTVCNAPDSDLWHTLIEADNYHALQLLEYLYAGKVDCIYIDPPYNTGARDWKYNNDYVDNNDQYRHSKWLSMMQKRLKLAKKLLNPADSVLIVTIDEKEYLHLGCLLEEMFTEARMQMISSVINRQGVARDNEFARVNEYIFMVMIGAAFPARLPLSNEWLLGSEKTLEKKNEIYWSGLLRRGSNNTRKHSPGCFYPIVISKKSNRVVYIGEITETQEDIDQRFNKEDFITCYPIRPDNTEGCWQLSAEKLKEALDKGFVRFGKPNKKQGLTLYYLARGERLKIERGIFKIQDRNPIDGSVIIVQGETSAEYPASNQWSIASHDSSQYGTILNKQFLVDRRFPYPKSLYAEHDTIRFFVADKPSALIVDFFAGSGTTLHAVNLLNAEDGGHRRCIMVTNNEVSDAEAKEMSACGLQPGDEEWEKLGIARYVTWPRTVCSIEGHDVNGNPLKGTYLAFVYIDSGYDTNTKRHLRCKSAGNDVKWGFLRNMLVFWWEAGKAFHRQYLNNV